MVSKFVGITCLAITLPCLAQNPQSPSSSDSLTVRSDDLLITPKNGQSRDQLWRDRYDCYSWAKSQSGFDPANLGTNSSPRGGASSRVDYNRALSACLEGKGYSVRNAAPPVAAPPPPIRPVPQAYVEHYAPPPPQIKYHPFSFQIDGGYTFTAGNTKQFIDEAGNVGLGLTWYPSSALPIGLRVDGSYSRFDARDGLLNQSGVGYSFGHEDIYGGDADVQLDLAHGSSRYKFYLFGGAGWYREQTRLKQVSYQSGVFCGFYSCDRGFGPVVTAEERSTSPWRTAWNAGVGFETALADHASFFIEGRYLRIGPTDQKLQLIPVRFGFRF
jgi:opacity protein-like surface antigen